MMKKIAIVTGATGGIGTEFVKQLLSEELDEIWIIARNREKLEALKEQYGERIVSISMDLSDIAELGKIDNMLGEQQPCIKYLINNAGLAKMASSQDFTTEEISRTIDVNCKTPAILCNLCLPYMTKGSRILNISSASAFQPNPYINLYAATKVFLRSYSRALNMELEGTGITVTAVCPSWVDTELLPKEMNGRRVRFPGMVTADRVVKQALKDAKRGRDMSVCSLYVKCQHVNVKLMPQRLVMKIWMSSIRKYIQ